MTANTTTVLPDARALVAQFGRQVGHCYEFGTGLEISGKAALDLFHAINTVLATQPAPDAAVPAGEGIEEAAENWLDQRVAPEHSRDRDYGADDMVDAFIAGAAAPKVASEGAGLRKIIRDMLDGVAGARDAARAALSTDATDGATGGGEDVTRAVDGALRTALVDSTEHVEWLATGADLLEQAARECQAVWRCAIGDFVGALDVLKGQWKDSRRKPERIAGEKLAAVLDLVRAARSPAPSNYSEASAAGNALIDLVRRALSARNLTEGGEA